MSYQVVYYSRKGSTKKIADAIALELDVIAEDAQKAELQKNSVIFLGSGCYGGKPGKQMQQFIENNDFQSMDVALFGTSGGGVGKEVNAMATLLSDKKANIKETFFCKGKFWIINRNKPSIDDIEQAKNFVKKMIK